MLFQQKQKNLSSSSFMIKIKIFNVSTFGRNFKCAIQFDEIIISDNVSTSSSPLFQIAINVAKLHRVPLLLARDDENDDDDSSSVFPPPPPYFSISPEEATLFFLASHHQIAKDQQSLEKSFEFTFSKKQNNDDDDEKLFSQVVENTLKSPRFAAFLYLASLLKKNDQQQQPNSCNDFWLVPRCDAAAFGAAFSCYLETAVAANHQQQFITMSSNKNKNSSSSLMMNHSLRNTRHNHNKTQEDHAISLVFSRFLTSSSLEKGKIKNIPAHEECGYIRLAKTVKKEAWILWISEKPDEISGSGDDEEKNRMMMKMTLEEILARFDFDLVKLCS